VVEGKRIPATYRPQPSYPRRTLSGVRQAREDYAKQFGGDVQKMMDDLRRRNAETGRTTVTRVIAITQGGPN